MKFFSKEKRPILLFRLVFIYIIAFSIWWAILLVRKNNQLYEEKIAHQAMIHQYSNATTDFESTTIYGELINKQKRQSFMIVTEGAVFGILLIAGLMIVSRAFAKEVKLSQQQRNFMLSIPHELKSPLAAIKLAIQTVLNRRIDEEKRNFFLKNSLEDTERLNHLVENILLAAKVDAQAYGFAVEPFNLSALCQHYIDRLSQTKGKGHHFVSDIEDDLTLEADKMAMESLVLNLLDNAIKYSTKGSNINLTLAQTSQSLLLTIKDEGVGIPKNEQNQVFKKFYRVGNEDTRNAKGTGIGLFLVKRIVEIHKGKIRLLDNQPKGLKVEVQLPKQQE